MKPEEIQTWDSFLKRTPLFAGLSVEDLSKLAARLQLLSLPKGATIFKQGDESDALYLIVSGHARRYRSVEGQETLVAYLGRGDVIGETGMLTGGPRSATVRVDATSELLKLPRKDFEECLRAHPPILLHLSRTLASRLIEGGQAAAKPSAEQARLVAFDCALPRRDRALIAWRLGAELAAQTRKKVLVVDLAPEPGDIARAAGLKPAPVAETALRAANLRDPSALAALAQEHPSGVRILSVSPATLGGRLFSQLYLFLNAVRDSHELALMCLGGPRGDVERAALTEADLILMAGCDAMRPQYRHMEVEVPPLAEEARRILRLWIGDLEPEDAPLLIGAERVVVPWSEAAVEAYEKDGRSDAAFAVEPKAAKALGRLARRLGGVQVGLALGTGAALGHSTIGVLKVLKREGIPVDMIAGTSMGSLIAGCYAAGYEPEEIEQLAMRIDKAWVYENLFWDITVPRSGLFAGDTLLRFIRSYMGSREFSDMELPFACVAADIETGEEVVLRQGRVAEAIRASCGLPLIFEPTQLSGRWLVDGGIVNPVPTRVIADMGADILLAVNLTMPAGERKNKVKERHSRRLLDQPLNLETLRQAAMPVLPKAFRAPNFPEVFFQMIYTMEYEVAQSRLDIAHVTMFPDLKGFSWTELHRAGEIIAAGERAAEEALPRLKALIPAFRP
ncbi:MAG: patatin-like phospholipase family protein [Elusimicrobia bacterium]|nr:patatin-like phospholipase family protein [Elusimicrobiota bacterium]